MKKSILILLAISIAAGSFLGCKRRVQRISPDQQVDLSGRWNDTDSKLVAQTMIQDAMTRPWHNNYFTRTGKKPTIIVGMVTNKTAELIQPETFIKDLERECINSGFVRVVQNSEFREKVRQERADQQEFASKETAKKWGKELGADFMLFGTINSITDQYKKKKVIFYQVDLELTDMETNEVVWIGDKKIKKLITN